MMELQQHFSVCTNEYEYEAGEGGTEIQKMQNDVVKTEDIYQTLQYPSADKGNINSVTLFAECFKRKYVFILFAVNIVILITILTIVGLNYSNNKETQQIKGQKEVWLLYDNVFYLFWSDDSDCETAEIFCSMRNASLAVLSLHNKGWLMTRTKGKQFLVSKPSSDGSGDSTSSSADLVKPQDDDDQDGECGIMTPDVDTDHGDGFVCERVVGKHISSLKKS